MLRLVFSLPCSNTGKTCSPHMHRGAVSPGAGTRGSRAVLPARATQLWSPAGARRCPACGAGHWRKSDKSCFPRVTKLEKQHAATSLCSFLSGKKGCFPLGLKYGGVLNVRDKYQGATGFAQSKEALEVEPNHFI